MAAFSQPFIWQERNNKKKAILFFNKQRPHIRIYIGHNYLLRPDNVASNYGL
jgi:hypothetical protein